jgi:hypothetical protein
MEGQIIGAIVAVLIALGTAFIKGYFDKKANDRKLEEARIENEKKNNERDEINDKKLSTQINIVLNRQESIDLILTDNEKVLKNIEKLLMEHILADDFVKNFVNAVRFKSNEILSWTKSANDEHKIILSGWAESIISFGLIFHEDKNRHDDKETFKKHLLQEMDRHIKRYYSNADSLVNGIRILKGRKYRFSAFLKESKIHQRTDYFIGVLAENGLDECATIKTFTKYIDEFYQLFFTAVSTWEALPEQTLNDAA